MSAGHIRPRGPGAWELKYDAGRDPVTGRRVIRYKTVRGGKKDAQRELRALLSQVDGGTFADAGKLTVGEFLKTWLAGRRHSIARKTHERYEGLLTQHIEPTIGGVLLRKITTAALNSFYADRLERGRLNGKGGLSAQTVRHIDRLLHKGFRDAMRQRLLSHNPTEFAERPRVEKRPKPTLTDAELKAVVGKAQGGQFYLPLLFVFCTGVRRGELLALRSLDIDLSAAVATVTRTVEQTKAGIRIKDVKTAAGRRRIDLPAVLVDAIRTHQVQQKEQALALGTGWTPEALLFPALDGGPRNPRAFTKAITRLGLRAGVAGFSPHAGRHDHFTRLLMSGIHPKVAQVRAGHSSIAVTLDVYSHAVDGMQREAAEHTDNLFRPLTKG